MRRTAIAAMAMTLLVVGIGAAGAQTTTTSSTTSSSTSSTSTPTSTSTTVPPTTVVPTPRTPSAIPTATLIGATGQVTGEVGSYCWEAAPPSVGECRHVDYFFGGPNPAQALTVTQGETVTLRYDPALAVESVVVTVWGGASGSATLAVPASNPARFPVDLRVGTTVVSFSVRFAGVPTNFVSYSFKLQVLARAATTTVPPARPAEPSRSGGLSLTG
ncbi:MAG: hypothetical protein M3450_01180 [Actinomycetota bacterium]|nr:hypothetical protein [Actinomycetota bacterium]